MKNLNNLQQARISFATSSEVKTWAEDKQVTTAETGTKSIKESIYSTEIFGQGPDSINKMGYIELAVPVVHPLFTKPLAKLLNISQKNFKEIMYYKKYLQPAEPPSSQPIIISVAEFLEKPENQAGFGTGAAILKVALEKYGPQQLQSLAAILAPRKAKEAQARLGYIQSFLKSSLQPKDLVISTIPVLPLPLRPKPISRDSFYFSDPLNEIYTRLLRTNEAIVRLLAEAEKGKTSLTFLNLECCKLQAYFDALISKGEYNLLNDIPDYKSLAEKLTHKSGIVRQRLLGKRIDYSGRSVIVPDPTLKMDECGLPKLMALELFRPFLLKRLAGAKPLSDSDKLLYDAQINEALVALRQEITEVTQKTHPLVKELEQLILEADKVVLLNRTPTLHKLNIQAFKPVLKDDLAIHLHPLVCQGFNADFDGDCMSVSLPISEAAQKEALEKMLPSHNLFKPGTGEIVASLSQGMILGIFDSTQILHTGRIFYDSQEAAEAALGTGYENSRKAIDLPLSALDSQDNWTDSDYYDKTDARFVYEDDEFDEAIDDFEYEEEPITTSLGNLYFEKEVIPSELKPLAEEPKPFDKKRLENLIRHPNLARYPEQLVSFLQKLMQLGFAKVTEAGISFAISDFPNLPSKKEHLQQLEAAIKDKQPKETELIKKYQDTRDKIFQDFDEKITHSDMNNQANPLDTIHKSGARGDANQWKQLRGMKLFFHEADGTLIPIPVTEDFYEGLSELSYFISSHGTRKGISDTALVTADSGALNRHLVLALQDVTIAAEDCGTTSKNRSIITCRLKRPGICQRCYGKHPATGKLTPLGTHVGIIASQSLSEPTTQFSLDSFHTGGDASQQEAKSRLSLLNKLLNATSEDLNNALADYKKSNLNEPQASEMAFQTLIDKLKELINSIYAEAGKKVLSQHIEVLLRQQLTLDDQGRCVAIKSLSNCISEKNVLTRLGFENTERALTTAVLEEAVDDLSNLNSRILLGKTLPETL